MIGNKHMGVCFFPIILGFFYQLGTATMIDYRIMRRLAGTDDPNQGTVIAWGNALSMGEIRQESLLHAVQQDFYANNPVYEYSLQVYIIVAEHSHGWWDMRALRSIPPRWDEVTIKGRSSMAQLFTSNDVPFAGDDTLFTNFTAADIPVAGIDVPAFMAIA